MRRSPAARARAAPEAEIRRSLRRATTTTTGRRSPSPPETCSAVCACARSCADGSASTRARSMPFGTTRSRPPGWSASPAQGARDGRADRDGAVGGEADGDQLGRECERHGPARDDEWLRQPPPPAEPSVEMPPCPGSSRRAAPGPCRPGRGAAVDEDVRGHEHRVGEETDAGGDPARDLVLVAGGAFEQAHARRSTRAARPARTPRGRRDWRKNVASRGVEPEREVVEGDVAGEGPQPRRVVDGRQGVVVGDEVERVLGAARSGPGSSMCCWMAPK